ncbi:CRISPR-associated helicase Cas3' [Streptomyces sp. 4N509B]|uniref:CRISPR-associated helicase Cas3' n=1 Tax=Streptomyces sp. 4N509B TaxID=3457413 RepID=UPI003FCF04A9
MGLPVGTLMYLGVLWGKSARYGGGRMNLLISHMLDTAAVAERMWDGYLAPSVREMLERVSGGDGRLFFMWLCGIHDLGKATPAHQALDEEGQRAVLATGLQWRRSVVDGRRGRWRHDKAGGKIVRDVLSGVWNPGAVGWVWPLVAGHHGRVPSVSVYRGGGLSELHGRSPEWRDAQDAVLTVFTRCLGYAGLGDVEPVMTPSKAEQLCLSGLIVKADWIASDTRQGRFQGLGRLAEVSLAGARVRADQAWRSLRLRGGWGRLPHPAQGDLLQRRFKVSARPSQSLLVDIAWSIPSPGLIFVEAPMGEGKTKGMLAAVEVLAARFGTDGVFLGMPTQATCDPMYDEVRGWVEKVAPDLADHVGLLHGKRRFNLSWRKAWSTKDRGDLPAWDGSVGADEFGMDDVFGAGAVGASTCSCSEEISGPSEWFLGPKRGLLCPLVVGTIDQLLLAATRTKHVMLRFAGLAGKVVVLDEVHAADVYMRQFLSEGLRWLGQARVPVMLLSATLPPAQRSMLARAYLEGALGQVDADVSGLPEPEGYPSVTAVFAHHDGPGFLSGSAASWRPSQPVRVAWLPDVSRDGAAVVQVVKEKLADGGVALVVLNTVERAQRVYEQLAQAFPGEAELLHGRLCAAHRADRTRSCLEFLGPDAGKERPERRVVVATQLAEQSFDIDADLLVSDLAPVDLLLQRIGRLHRHQHTRRPPHLMQAEVLVTGIAPSKKGSVPELLGASCGIYGRHRLLRTAALIARDAGLPGEKQEGVVWSVPEQVPRLVAEVYGEGRFCPTEWSAAEESASEEWRTQEETRAAEARRFVLGRQGEWAKPTLDGLHVAGVGYASDEELRDAVVRDGEMAAEVVIVRRAENGYRALVGGAWLGVHGEACERDTVCDAAIGGLTRLPAKNGRLAAAVEKELRPLDGWLHVQGLRYARALVLEKSGFAHLAGFRIGYDERLGLTVEDETRP